MSQLESQVEQLKEDLAESQRDTRIANDRGEEYKAKVEKHSEEVSFLSSTLIGRIAVDRSAHAAGH